MEIKVNNFKLRHAPFSLSPTFDKHSEGLQRINFLNIFSIKDQKKIAKKNSGKIEYTEVSNKKIKENLGREKLNLTPLHKGENLVSETLNLTPMHKGIVKRIEPTKKFTNYHISNKEKREKSKKKAETVALAIVKSEKTLDMKENENLLSFKTIKKDSNIKMQKYKNTPENELKILYYFRFHQHSLLINCGQKEKIEEIHNSNAVQPFLQNIKKNAITSDDLKEQETISHRLLKIISTKSKYKSRLKLVYSKSLGLKSINFEPKKRSTLVPSKVSKKITIQEEKKEIVSAQNITSSAMNELDYWRKKNNLPIDAKIFIIIGNYYALRNGLLKRGWYENPDITSLVFHFKYVSKVRDIDFGNIKDEQIVNHFSNTGCFTTKIGFCRNIRNLIWFHNIDVDAFYPRCYDLSESADFDDFVEEYKFTMAESILKEFLNHYKNKQICLDKFYELKIKIAILAIYKKNWDIFEKIFNIRSGISPIISNKEWEILLAKNICDLSKEMNENYDSLRSAANVALGLNDDSNLQDIFFKVKHILEELMKKNPQYNLNGSQNIWILKPTSLSRGRGIKCFNNLFEIINHIYGKKSQFVCQKYIENPLLINKKKFDIRQWVLVTNWEPLTIWFYKESYVRFGAEIYDPLNLNNRFIHLTNNSIAKYSEKFEQSEIEGNMWSMQDFINYLIQETGEDIFTTDIQPKFKKYVINALTSVKEMVTKRRNTFEIFGFDFMIDEKYHPWIIEINSSPAMDYSTSITEKLVQIFLEDVIKVIIDHGMKRKGQKKKIDTGDFICICKGNRIKI